MSPSSSGPRVLVVNNRDSFVRTLAGYIGELGADVQLVDAEDTDHAVDALRTVQALVLSPGPGAPSDAIAAKRILHASRSANLPVLGVCLGHQVLGEMWGANVGTAAAPMHGMTSRITHSGRGVFQNVPEGVTVGRYHSLAIDPRTLPAAVEVTATTEDGTVMAVQHVTQPLTGVQFHPESVLTEYGYRMLGNWLSQACGAAPTQLAERRFARGMAD